MQLFSTHVCTHTNTHSRKHARTHPPNTHPHPHIKHPPTCTDTHTKTIHTHTQISDSLKFSGPSCLEFVNLFNEVFSVGSGCRHHVLLLTTQDICVIHVPPATHTQGRGFPFLVYTSPINILYTNLIVLLPSLVWNYHKTTTTTTHPPTHPPAAAAAAAAAAMYHTMIEFLHFMCAPLQSILYTKITLHCLHN